VSQPYILIPTCRTSTEATPTCRTATSVTSTERTGSSIGSTDKFVSTTFETPVLTGSGDYGTPDVIDPTLNVGDVLESWNINASYTQDIDVEFRHYNENSFSVYVKNNVSIADDFNSTDDHGRLEIRNQAGTVLATYQDFTYNVWKNCGTINYSQGTQFGPVVVLDYDQLDGYVPLPPTEQYQFILQAPSASLQLTLLHRDITPGAPQFYLEIQNQTGAVIQAHNYNVPDWPTWHAYDVAVPAGTTQVKFRFKLTTGSTYEGDWYTYNYPTAVGDTITEGVGTLWTPDVFIPAPDEALTWIVDSFSKPNAVASLSGDQEFLAGVIYLWPTTGSPDGTFEFNAHNLDSSGFPGTDDTWNLLNVTDQGYLVRITDGTVDPNTPPYVTGTVTELGPMLLITNF
jgi:hypothetical protein